jgi:hypothetical protein
MAAPRTIPQLGICMPAIDVFRLNHSMTILQIRPPAEAAYLSPIVNSKTWSLAHRYPNTTLFLPGVTDTSLISLPQVGQGGQIGGTLS